MIQVRRAVLKKPISGIGLALAFIALMIAYSGSYLATDFHEEASKNQNHVGF